METHGLFQNGTFINEIKLRIAILELLIFKGLLSKVILDQPLFSTVLVKSVTFNLEF